MQNNIHNLCSQFLNDPLIITVCYFIKIKLGTGFYIKDYQIHLEIPGNAHAKVMSNSLHGKDQLLIN